MQNIKPRAIMEYALEMKNYRKVAVLPLIGVHSAAILGVEPKLPFTNAKVMAKLQEKMAHFYKPDGVFPFMDLTVEAEALGCGLEWGDVPSISEHLTIDNVLERLDSEIAEKGRIPVFLEAVSIMSEKLASDYMVGAYITGPLTLASSIIGVEKMMKALIRKVDYAQALIEFSEKVCESYASLLIEHNAECIMVAEPVGSLITSKHFEKYLFGPLKNLVRAIKHKGAWSILHICGDANHIFELMGSVGVHALSIDDPVDLQKAFLTARNASIMGNINTRSMLVSSSFYIEKLCTEAVEKADRSRFILSTGCEVPLQTPAKNLKAMIKTARRYNLFT